MNHASLIAGLVVFFVQSVANGVDGCPNWTESAPACPLSGGTMLSDNLPALVHVLGIQTGSPEEDESFVVDSVEKILISSGANLPIVVVPTREGLMEKIKVRIGKLKNDNVQAERFFKSIVSADVGEWPQDSFQAFTGPNGKPVLRTIRQRKNVDGNLLPSQEAKSIVDSVNKACPNLLELGEPLPPNEVEYRDHESANEGGNMEGLPGGICLTGKNLAFDKMGKHLCPNKEDFLQLDTNFLKVGHVDELVGVVSTPGAKHPCNFAITLASPKKAIEAMRNKPKELVLKAFTSGNPKQNKTLQRYFASLPGRSLFAQILINRGTKPQTELQAGPHDSTKTTLGGGVAIPSEWSEILKALATATNEEFLKALESEEYGKANAEIQKVMDENRLLIEAKLKTRLPACKPRFVELPVLFTGGIVMKDGKAILANGQSEAIFPNVVNAVPVEGKSIVPNVFHEALEKTAKASLKEVGVEVELVNTMSRNIAGGNMHCGSNTIRYCRKK